MPRSFVNDPLRTGAPLWEAAARAHAKENSLAPAMVSQELTVERYDGVTDEQRVLLLRGPLTVETAPRFEQAVRSESAETMILDLSDVPYMDSVGLGSLVTAYVSHQKTGRCLVLTGVTPRVRKVLEITKVHQFFMTFPTTWEAVEALANTGTA